MMTRQERTLKEIAECEGLSDVTISKNGHYKVSGMIDQHKMVFSVSSSPSCPHSIANYTKDIRRRVRALPSDPMNNDAWRQVA